MIPYGRQEILAEDIEAVVAVLQSDFITQGPAVVQFEQALAKEVGAAQAVAFNSATSALHVACLALGLGAGDWLWTVPNTFVASANCALYCGAQVDFVDIDPRSYNMSVDALAEKLRWAEGAGKLPKVVIPVHFAGQSCQMSEIKALADQYGFALIEDASHAIGGRYLDQPIGACQYADITVFSFHPVKIITTAEGGVATCKSKQLADTLARLRSHGVTRDPSLISAEDEGGWYYEQIELGFNYRMSDLHAALGVSQLQRLSTYIERRHEIKQRYDALLADLPLTVPWQHPDSHSALHLYPIQLHDRAERRRVFDDLRQAGIGVNVHYIPVHTQPYYQKRGFAWGDFPQAEAYYQGAISLPMFPTLSAAQQDEVVMALQKALA
ncbi:MAG: UDP-4-amino-4,6-dideoxy-N-acetyl-beta-L-altrosamine transaminase [Gammaproteobacteria bacterium]|nr:UDP-4-amino-4,6-dideoxy-N-acetyl-beta-L-altrosamine transaminase [Gammaproteobacteria bacterium]